MHREMLKTVQDRDVLTMETNRKSNMAYQMAPTAMTLNGLEGRSLTAGLFRCNSLTISAAFYKISTDSVLTQSLGDS